MHKLERPTQPNELIDAKQAYTGSISQDEAWRSFKKDSVRESLKNAQDGLCAYCEIKLSQDTRIDHFKPKKLDYRLTFDWDNLVLSCDGIDSCDNKKGGEFEEYWINPYITDPASMFKFYSDGQIEGATQEAQKVIEDFGLDSPRLIMKRKGMLSFLTEELLDDIDTLEYYKNMDYPMFPTAYKQIIDKISGE